MPTDARDKAVEEALKEQCSGAYHDAHWHDPRTCGVCSSLRPYLSILWQRAQEAEREENCKAVCWHCEAGRPVSRSGATKRLWMHTGLSHDCWQPCNASPIRNRFADRAEDDQQERIDAKRAEMKARRAARASEEPKP